MKVETARLIVKSTLALGILSLLLELVYWMSTPVYAECSTVQGVTSCQYDYWRNTGGRIFIPLIVGAVLVTVGSFILFSKIGRHGTSGQNSKSFRSDTSSGSATIGSLRRTLSLIDILVPSTTVLVLLALAFVRAWSGLPIVYTGPCLGPLLGYPGPNWCLAVDWFGLWLDSIFYAALAYCSVFVILKFKTPVPIPPR